LQLYSTNSSNALETNHNHLGLFVLRSPRTVSFINGTTSDSEHGVQDRQTSWAHNALDQRPAMFCRRR